MAYLINDQEVLCKLNEMITTDRSYNNNLMCNIRGLPLSGKVSERVNNLCLKYITIMEERKSILSELDEEIKAHLNSTCASMGVRRN